MGSKGGTGQTLFDRLRASKEDKANKAFALKRDQSLSAGSGPDAEAARARLGTARVTRPTILSSRNMRGLR